MNKTVSTILKVIGAVTVLAGIAAAVVCYLNKKGIIGCCCISGCEDDCGEFEDYECDDESCGDEEESCCESAEEAPADAE